MYKLSNEKKKELMNILAENLPVFRAKLAITQTDLASMIGVTKNTLTQIENKKREMTWVTFVALVLLFHNIEKTKPLIDTFNLYPEELRRLFLAD